MLAVTGGIIYWRARVKFDHVKAGCPCPEGQFDGWQTASNISYGLMAVGGAALLGGAAWWFFDRRSTTSGSYGVAVDPRGVYLMGSF